MKKRILFFLLALLPAMGLFAYDFKYGDLYYSIKSNSEVAVTSGDYSGLTSANIPASVTYNGTTYSVTSIEEKTFNGCARLTSISIPESMASIGESAFSDCTNLTSIIWNAKACMDFTIKNSPFYGCYPEWYDCEESTGPAGCERWIYDFDLRSQITSFVFGNNVRHIPAYLCNGLKSLTSITLPNGVTSLGDAAFADCTGFTAITIPYSVTSIGWNAFNGCTGLTKVNYTGGVKGWLSIDMQSNPLSYAKKLYINNTLLTNLIIPEGTDRISSNFSGCINITSVSIPNSVTSIGDWAFSSCTGLTSITIPNSVTSIGGYAFSGCTGLTSITIPNSVTSIGGSAFEGCTGLTAITIPNSVTSIRDGAFKDCTGLTSITIPNSVTSIGGYAFSGCTGLTSITIPNSVTSIGGSAFEGCTGLTAITIPNSVTSIRDGAFKDCTGLTSIVWNAKNCGETINASWNYDCDEWGNCEYRESYSYGPFSSAAEHITSFTFGDEVETIPDYLCSGMSNLRNTMIPHGVTSIGDSTFFGCTGLTSIIWNVKSYEDFSYDTWYDYGYEYERSNNPFYSIRSQIKSFTFGDSVVAIPAYMCYKMDSLTSITIGNSVTSIGWNAFNGCTGLTKVNYSGDVEGWYNMVDNTFSSGYQLYLNNVLLTDLVIPKDIAAVSSAFAYCTSLSSVTIPSDVAFIEVGAFKGCKNLTSVVWNAKSCESLFYDDYYGDYRYSKDSPFYGICTQIKSFTFGDSVVAIPAHMCYEMDSLISISFGKNITKIGECALCGCSNLQSVYWNIASDSIESPFGYFIDGDYYGDSKNITSFTLGDNVVSIPNNLCSDMGITTVSIPHSVTNIGENAFSNCRKLKSVTLGKNVKKIGSEAFSGCDTLKSVHYQGTLSDWMDISFEGYDMNQYSVYEQHKGSNPLEYADSLFIGNSYVTDITIPDGVTTIKRCTFFGYAGLQSVKLPNSLKEIGEGAFYGCTSLTSQLSLPNVTSIGQWTFHSTGIQGTLNIPHSVTSIGDEAFRYCDGIDTLIIGNGIVDIDDQFEDCSGITYLQLGSGVKTLGSGAFNDSEKLKRIVCYAIEPPASRKGSFYNYNIHVQVPCDNLEDYETDAVWGSFKYLECVGAEKTETNGKVLITPRDNDADITWPTNSNADTYTILITQDGTEICTLVFNADGQLTRIAFAAPARNGEQHRTPAALLTQDGYRFTVTGLSSGTLYAYAIDVKDAKSSTLNTYKGSFSTTGGTTGIEDIPTTNKTLDSDTPRKVFRDGQVYILRGGKTYTLTGVEVK